MKLGLVGMPLSSRQRPLTETYEEFARTVELADELGYAEVFIGEHHTSHFLPVTAPISFLASLVSRTSRIRLGTGVVALPYHHPAAVAGEIAQLDHLSAGRLNVGVGSGGLIPDMELYGMLDKTSRHEAFAQSLEAILELWQSNAPFEVHTRRVSMGVTEHAHAELGLGSVLKPLQQPHPPLFVTAMSPRSPSLRWAVEHGCNPISAHFASRATLKTHGDELRTATAAVRDEAQLTQWRVARHVVVRETDSEAEDALFAEDSLTRFSVDYLWRLLVAGELSDAMRPASCESDAEVTVDALLRDLVLWGSTETVAEQIQVLREDIGDFGTLLVPLVDGADWQNAGERQTLRRLGQAVALRQL